MGKFGYEKCLTCGKEIRSTKKKLHKCNVGARKECFICGKTFAYGYFAEHKRVCETNNFWKQHGLFMRFLLKVIRIFNRGLKTDRYIGGKKSKRQIVDEMGYENLPLNRAQRLLQDYAKNGEENDLKKLKDIAKEYSINLENIEEFDAMKDVETNSPPEISCRQVIFSYLEEKDHINDNVKNLINKKLSKKDYPTDEELKKNVILWEHIQELRKAYDYNEYYENFYYMFIEYYEKRNTFKCEFCSNFFVRMKYHLKNCEVFKMKYDEEGKREEWMEYYLRKFYKADTWKQDKLNRVINFYKGYSLKYFIETVAKYIKNPLKFMNKILDGRMKYKEIINPRKKFNFKEFLKEVDEFKPKIIDKKDEIKSEKDSKKEGNYIENNEDLDNFITDIEKSDKNYINEENENDKLDDLIADIEDQMGCEPDEVLEEKSIESIEKIGYENIKNTWFKLIEGNSNASDEKQEGKNIINKWFKNEIEKNNLDEKDKKELDDEKSSINEAELFKEDLFKKSNK